MGNAFDCCLRANTVKHADLPLNCETNFYTEEFQVKTIRRGSSISPKQADMFNLKTENNEMLIRNQDEFIKSYTNILRSFPNLPDDGTFSQTSVETYMKNTRGPINYLIVNIYKKEIQDDNPKETLIINPYGLPKSKRGKLDGRTFFGVLKNKSLKLTDWTFDVEEFQDFFSQSDLERGVNFFEIKFNTENGKYYVKDLLSGIPSLMKIKNETVLKTSSVINVGESYILLNIEGEKEKESFTEYLKTINVKVFNRNGQLVHDPINFQPSKSAIKIGRDRDCEIVISDPSVSKVHCTIQYDNIVGWTIRDGFYSKKNTSRTSEVFVPSLNGSWLFLKENSVIVDGMVIQSGSTTFQCFLEEK